ncbi:MAG: hypothetical protein F4148_02680 [Caldilineaceae bacterium SB0675_bin_29]|uniref:Uncharacterized protein n=1 Tax=Caldilineaceae bacterium SB0675_bin_29 TaxID=2605266 RepID=A0A6B1FVP0_9CHLR|nr:hypothetical protein [Caldilineaceae bacterium SB0675_bin_29]
MTGDALYPRFAEQPLTEALEDSAVVQIQGPRQSGKITLAPMTCTSEDLAGGRRSPRTLAAQRSFSFAPGARGAL